MYLDIAKAFDSVPHHLLLERLVALGTEPSLVLAVATLIRGHVNWLGGEPISIANGVLQGSILGPLLWNVFLDPLLVRLEQELADSGGVEWLGVDRIVSPVSFFADDGALLCTSVAQVQRVLDVCYAWGKEALIEFSAKKTKVQVLWAAVSVKRAREECRVNLGGAPIEVVETFSYLGAEIGLVERGGAGRGGKRRWCAVATVSPAKLEKAERRADWLATVANARFGLHPLIARDIIRAKSVTVALYGCEVLELADEERADVMLSKALHGALGTYARTHRWLVYSELGCPRVSSTARRMVLSGCARMMCSAAPIAPTLAAVVLSLRACGKWCSDDRRGRGGGLSGGGRGSAVATGGDLLDTASDVSPCVLCELPYAKLLVAAMSYMAASEEIAKALVAALTNCARAVAAAVGGGATAKPTCVDELPTTSEALRRVLARGARPAWVRVWPRVQKTLTKVWLAAVDEAVDRALVATERRWWRDEAARTSFCSTLLAGSFPSKVAHLDPQPYFKAVRDRHRCAMVFVFRTLRFNPPTTEAATTPPCWLCGASGADTPAHVLGACRPRDSAVADRLAAVVSEMRQLVGSGTVAEGGLLARGLCGLVRGVAGSTEARMAVGGGKSGAPAKPSVEAMQRRLVRGAELFSAV